jgi:hypothetical protein
VIKNNRRRENEENKKNIITNISDNDAIVIGIGGIWNRNNFRNTFKGKREDGRGGYKQRNIYG